MITLGLSEAADLLPLPCSNLPLIKAWISDLTLLGNPVGAHNRVHLLQGLHY